MGKGCGGETYFPFAAPSDVEMKRRAELSHLGVEMTSEGGLEVRPIRGQALLFWSVGREGREDPAAAHSAEPVVHGTKWIATRWYRELEWALPPAGH